MSADRASGRFDRALAGVDDWPVDSVSVAVVDSGGALATRGDEEKTYELASVTKLLVAFGALIAVEEGAIFLDDAAGPDGSTVRHLLAHASGLDMSDREKTRAEPGKRRIYSSAGFEELADHIEDATGIDFSEYLRLGVFEPLGMTDTVLYGSAGHEARSTLSDLGRFTRELVAPTLIDERTLADAVAEQFDGLDGIVPGYGMQKPCPWGLGFELREAKHPHWTGQHNSPDTFGHFGQSGTLLWVEPELDTALVVLTDREFGDWAKPLWPQLSDAVVDAATRRIRDEDALGG